MKSEIWNNGARVAQTEGRATEVVQGFKSVALVISLSTDEGGVFGLYRPESGIRLSVDPRIPKPSELYRDVEYSRMCRDIGWDVAAPVFPWQLKDGDMGVIRPYWRQTKNMEVYHFKRDLLLGSGTAFWIKVAIADYVFGIGDRVSNDFLITGDGLFVVDSGFSYLPGLEVVGQQSIVRETIIGENIPEKMLDDLKLFFRKPVQSIYLAGDETFWIGQRIQRILEVGKVI